MEDDDENKLAVKMKLALENEDMKQYVLQQRDWYLQEYSWEAVVKRILKVWVSNENA